MKTLEEIINYKSDTLDERDIQRLLQFIPPTEWNKMGFELKENAPKPPPPVELNEETVKINLKHDLEFAFEKALNKRGISSSLMYSVIKMWLWVLDDELANVDNDELWYAQYGLPLYKAVAVKYGFDNPIGDDKGNERKYSSD